MKKLTILINRSILDISFISREILDYIYDYVDYRLYPYKQLGAFSYNTYTDLIDGINTPDLLTNILKGYVHLDNKYLNPLPLYSAYFFNVHTQHFFLTPREYKSIVINPKNYCLLLSDIFM